MTEEVKEKIAKLLSKSTTGMAFKEIKHKNFANETKTRDFLNDMRGNNYVKLTGFGAGIRYEITPQGRLRYLTGDEKSALVQTEKILVETLEPLQINEKIDVITVDANDIKLVVDIIANACESPEIKCFEADVLPDLRCNLSNYTSDETTEKQDAGAHYRIQYKGFNLDPFRIAKIYGMTSFPMMTILKKVLCAGNRGHKNYEQDLKDIICAVQRELEMIKEDG